MTEAVQRDLAALAERLRRSTVAVRERGGGGSGVVWAADGAIVTNAHVARGGRTEVELPDGRILPARVERRAERFDLALLRVEARDLEPLTVRDAGDLRPGELVVALGHPLGVPNALSIGVVRSKPGDLVRADVKLAPGNSGGPLTDARGALVGINAMVAMGSIALAVPSGVVRRFAGETHTPRLGVLLAPVIAAGEPAFAVVAVQSGGIGECSGVIVGDVVHGDPATLAAQPSLVVHRGGVPITLALRPEVAAAAA